MGRILKNRRLDENGLRILERGNGWYIGLDEETNRKRKIYTKKRKKKGGHNTENIRNHPKAGTGGFKQNPQNIQTGNVGNRIVKERQAKREANILWKENQNECLRVMLKMKRGTLLAYMLEWNMEGYDSILSRYDYAVTDEDRKGLDKSEPTMIQITSLSMVMHAKENPKFALNLLELLEGKAVSQVVLAENLDKKEATQKVKNETMDDYTKVLNVLKQRALGDDEEPMEEVVEALPESIESVAQSATNAAETGTSISEFENLLNELTSGEEA